jgi:hypothetical protein
MVRKACDLFLTWMVFQFSGFLLAQETSPALPAAPQPFPQNSLPAPAPFGTSNTPGQSGNTTPLAAPSTQPFPQAPQGQIPQPPAAPPYVPYQTGTPALPPLGLYQPAPLMPPPYVPYSDRNGLSLRGDPLLEGPAAPGWFFGLELDLVVPHITNGLNAVVTVPGFQPDLVAIGGAPLDWTGSPKFDLGYRFGEGLGEAVLSYRLLATDGRAILPGWDLDGSDAPLKTDLEMNVVDLDYVSRDFAPGGICDLRWRAGVRLASIHFDSRAEGFFLEQQASDNFFGAGPHVG